jgi:hypothetical protein
MAAVYNSSHMLLYQNGTLVGNTSKTGNIATNTSINASIGSMSWNNTNGPWDGKIDEVKIYERALTQDEIACHFANNCSLYGFWNDTSTLSAGLYYYTMVMMCMIRVGMGIMLIVLFVRHGRMKVDLGMQNISVVDLQIIVSLFLILIV